MPRRKDTAAPAPSNAQEATLMIGEFVGLDRDIARERLAAADAIDKIEAQRDSRIAELESQAKPLFAGLKAWWEAGGKDELAKGKRSAEIAGAKIGLRLTTPKVKFQRGFKAEDVVAFLKGLRWVRAKDFLRIKVELDRQAVIKAIHTDADAEAGAMLATRLYVDQKDEFFIDTGLDQDELKKEAAAS